MTFDPDLDLLLERELKAPPAIVWRCWTEPDLMKEWFCPRPWKLVEVEIEPRAGGIFRTIMEGPDGQRTEDGPPGSILLAEPGRRLVFGDAMGPGFRPREAPFMVADLTFAPTATGTAYRAHVMHTGPDKRKQHEDMGFHGGWTTAADQLEELARTLLA